MIGWEHAQYPLLHRELERLAEIHARHPHLTPYQASAAMNWTPAPTARERTSAPKPAHRVVETGRQLAGLYHPFARALARARILDRGARAPRTFGNPHCPP